MSQLIKKIIIINDEGEKVSAVSPLIISASRSTDIPAFFNKWFFHRFQKGYIKWINPFNRKPTYVSFKNTRVIVFWTKNADPILKYLDLLDRNNIHYYFQFTVNDYENEKFEPNVPSLSFRIETFKKLSKKIGKERVIWRFDPLILTDNLNVDKLVKKIKRVGEKLYPYTEKLVISFADILVYKKVRENMKKAGINYIEFTDGLMEEIGERISVLAKNWEITVATCSEEKDLTKYGIEKNRCIDDVLLIKLFSGDEILMNALGYSKKEQYFLFNSGKVTHNKKLKDRGQRKACGCIISKDIGMYNTCGHLCVYCYANYSKDRVLNNLRLHNWKKDSII